MKTGAGDLDRRVEILQMADVQDAYGATVKGFVSFGRYWAQRQDASDRENMAASGEEAVRVTRWKLRSTRKTRTITATMRLRYRDADYEITGISEVAGETRNSFLWLTTTVRADEA